MRLRWFAREGALECCGWSDSSGVSFHSLWHITSISSTDVETLSPTYMTWLVNIQGPVHTGHGGAPTGIFTESWQDQRICMFLCAQMCFRVLCEPCQRNFVFLLSSSSELQLLHVKLLFLYIHCTALRKMQLVSQGTNSSRVKAPLLTTSIICIVQNTTTDQSSNICTILAMWEMVCQCYLACTFQNSKTMRQCTHTHTERERERETERKKTAFERLLDLLTEILDPRLETCTIRAIARAAVCRTRVVFGKFCANFASGKLDAHSVVALVLSTKLIKETMIAFVRGRKQCAEDAAPKRFLRDMCATLQSFTLSTGKFCFFSASVGEMGKTSGCYCTRNSCSVCLRFSQDKKVEKRGEPENEPTAHVWEKMPMSVCKSGLHSGRQQWLDPGLKSSSLSDPNICFLRSDWASSCEDPACLGHCHGNTPAVPCFSQWEKMSLSAVRSSSENKDGCAGAADV